MEWKRRNFPGYFRNRISGFADGHRCDTGRVLTAIYLHEYTRPDSKITRLDKNCDKQPGGGAIDSLRFVRPGIFYRFYRRRMDSIGRSRRPSGMGAACDYLGGPDIVAFDPAGSDCVHGRGLCGRYPMNCAMPVTALGATRASDYCANYNPAGNAAFSREEYWR